MRLEGCLIHRLAGISMCSEPPDVDVKLDIVRVEERAVSGDEIINVLEIYPLTFRDSGLLLSRDDDRDSPGMLH